MPESASALASVAPAAIAQTLAIAVADEDENALRQNLRDAFLGALNERVAFLDRQQRRHVGLQFDPAMELKRQHRAGHGDHQSPCERGALHLQLAGGF